MISGISFKTFLRYMTLAAIFFCCIVLIAITANNPLGREQTQDYIQPDTQPETPNYSATDQFLQAEETSQMQERIFYLGQTITAVNVAATATMAEVYEAFSRCQRLETDIICQDRILGVEFAYPSVWGKIRPIFYQSQSLGRGVLFRYIFQNIHYKPSAGGMSLNFSGSRGATEIINFQGFTTFDETGLHKLEGCHFFS